MLNGWQTYNSWSKNPGIGNSNYWRPNENIQVVANFYYGNDTHNTGDSLLSSVHRFHHDDSFVARYYHNDNARGISQAAFSLNNHYGFQQGPGIKPSHNYMAGSSLAHRIWFNCNKLALTLRADYVTNPGGYLSFVPAATAAQPNAYDKAIAAGKDLNMKQFTATFDVMPSNYVTFRLEFVHRNANIPYFAGAGGTTSQTGFITDTPPATWLPDLVKTENRFIAAVNFRL